MESIQTAFLHLTSNYMFQTSNYALYVYDHTLTFSEEVEKIWPQPLNLATLLFYINRYITHCQFIILQVEFHETNWTTSLNGSIRCDRYVRFAGAATLSLVVIAELTLILRVYALYHSNKYILGFLLTVLSCQIFFMAWAVHVGERVPLPPGFPGCVLTGKNQWFAALWAAPLATDTCIFALTLWRTLRYKRMHKNMSIMHIILRDGTIYFAVIFSANLMNTLIYLLAVEDLKAVGASFSQILTSIMIARLQLNLRGSRRDDNFKSYITPVSSPPVTAHNGQFPGSSQPGPLTTAWTSSTETRADYGANTTFFTVGELGGELKGTFFESALGNKYFDEKEVIEQLEDSEVDVIELRPYP